MSVSPIWPAGSAVNDEGEITFHGRWETGLNAGGVQKADFKNYAKNPQCFVKLSDPDPRDPGKLS